VTVKQIRVYAPASIANLGPGFDVFGIALDGLGDTVLLEVISEPVVEIEVSGLEAGSLPVEAESNSAGAVLKHVIEDRGLDRGFRIKIDKGVPVGKGMGSSGASAAAAAHGACRVLGLELPQREYVELAALGEGAVAGSPHADNVSASLLGGFTVVGHEYEVLRLDPPEVEMVVVVPEVHYENKTKLARSLLPEKVGLREAVLNVGYASRMVAAVATGDPVLFGRSINDHLIEPYRAEMIPNFWRVKEAALDAGAYGCSIAGGGPSLFAVGEDPEEIGEAMAEAFADADVDSEIILTRPSKLGARVI
jgi:homoserine kinase